MLSDTQHNHGLFTENTRSSQSHAFQAGTAVFLKGLLLLTMKKYPLFFLLLLLPGLPLNAQHNFTVIAYYAGGPETVDSIPAEKLTHIIYSFCHLKGNKLNVDSGRDSL